MVIKKYLFLVIEIIIFIFLMRFYVTHSMLLPDSSKPYSAAIAHRLQVNALLQGKLLLSSNPFGLQRDFMFTDQGMSPSWGIGVSLLMLPFEWGAKLCGFAPFPDRWILLFYLTLMIIIFNLSLRLLLMTLGLNVYSVMGLFLRWYLIMFILFCPGMGSLIQVHYYIFEETILYGIICSSILLSLFWVLIRRPDKKIFLILCLVGGFVWLIRLTLISYGVVTVALAVVYIYKETRNIRLIFIGILCFLLGIFVNLTVNYFRCGSIFEIGGPATLSGTPAADYGVRFSYPYHWEPFWSAAKEFIGQLFFNSKWQASTFRWREHVFDPFNSSHFVLLTIASLFLIFFNFFKWRLSPNEKNPLFLKIFFYTIVWGLLVSGCLFIFYINLYSISSRYSSDFSIAFCAIIIALILLVLFWLSTYITWRKVLLTVFILISSGLFYICDQTFFRLAQRSFIGEGNVTNKDEINNIVASFNEEALSNPTLPEEFYCGHSYSVKGLGDQFAGWYWNSSCHVKAATSVFLPERRCVTLNYSTPDGQQWSSIQVKRNFTFLKLIDLKVIKTDSKTEIMEQFCTNSLTRNSIALYSVGWITPDKLSDNALPVILNSIRVSDKQGLH